MKDGTLKLTHDEALLGAYEYLNLYTPIRYWPPLSRTTVLQESSLEKRVHLSLARYAYIHETRHFHDFFGTFAGISLFFAHLEMLRNFLAFFEMIRGTGETWFTPFPEWADTSKFREIHARFLRSWSLYRNAAMRFTGAFRAVASSQQHIEDYVIYLDNRDSTDRIAAFPFDFGILEKGVRFSVYYPISLIALLEGNAHAIQRTLAEAEFPSDVANQFTPNKIDHRLPKGIEDLPKAYNSIAASTQPYNVTDFIVSKYLRLIHKQSSFQRQSIIRLTDIALGLSMIVPQVKDDLNLPKSFQVSDVGRNFVDALKQTPLENIISGEIKYPDVLLTIYTDLLTTVLDFEKPESIKYKGDLSSPLILLEAILRHEVIAPLIRARIESNHEVFYSVHEYMRKLPELPKVPVLEHIDGITFAPYMSDMAKDAWVKYVFLSRIVSELVGGSRMLTCPRAQGMIGEIGDLNYCTDGECRDHIGKGACNGWYRNKPRPLPKCLFADALKTIGA